MLAILVYIYNNLKKNTMLNNVYVLKIVYILQHMEIN